MTRQEFIEQVCIHNQSAFNRVVDFKVHPFSCSNKEFVDWAELHINALVEYATLLADAMYGKAEQPKDPLDDSIHVLTESVRDERLFHLLGVKTIREFVELQEFEILQYRNIGRKTISEISDNLEQYGYTIWNNNGKCKIKPVLKTNYLAQ